LVRTIVLLLLSAIPSLLSAQVFRPPARARDNVQFEQRVAPAGSGIASLHRMQGEPPWIHVQYYADFIEQGRKKRAYFQAFNIVPERRWFHFIDRREQGPAPHFEGTVVIPEDHDELFVAMVLEPADGMGGMNWNSRHLFDSYHWPAEDRSNVLVLDYEDCRSTTIYTTPRFEGLDEKSLGGGVTSNGYIYWRHTIGGERPTACFGLDVTFLPGLGSLPRTRADCNSAIASARQELAQNPENNESRYRLAWALLWAGDIGWSDYQPEKSLPLRREARELLRTCLKQEPTNLFYRAELRRLAWESGLHFGKAEDIQQIDEAAALLPLDVRELESAARFFQNSLGVRLQAAASDAEKQRIRDEIDTKTIQWLREDAWIWRRHPELYVRMKLQSYERDARRSSYAQRPEFQQLLAQMRIWLAGPRGPVLKATPGK